MKIMISPKSLRVMKHHAGQDYPCECCGFLVGRVQKKTDSRRIHIDKAVPAKNINQERSHDRYEIPPLEYLRLEKSLTETGSEIVGYYHSHPDHPSRPSEVDLTLFGGWPGYIYVIVAVDGKSSRLKKYDVTAWSLEEHRLASV